MPALPRHGQAGRFEVGRGHAPRLPDRRLAAGQRHGVEPGEPFEAFEVAVEELAAPDRPVRPVPRAVEDECERRALFAVLGEARCRVRVVVLDADERKALLLRPLRREVLGVEVVGDRLGLDAEHRRGRAEVVAEGVVGGGGIEVAEVGGEVGALLRRDAEGALQLGARGDEGARGDRERKRLRDEAP